MQDLLKDDEDYLPAGRAGSATQIAGPNKSNKAPTSTKLKFSHDQSVEQSKEPSIHAIDFIEGSSEKEQRAKGKGQWYWSCFAGKEAKEYCSGSGVIVGFYLQLSLPSAKASFWGIAT